MRLDHALILGVPRSTDLAQRLEREPGSTLPDRQHWVLRVLYGDPAVTIPRVRSLLGPDDEFFLALVPDASAIRRVASLGQWRNRLVVDRSLFDLLGEERHHWTLERTHDDMDLVVFAPRWRSEAKHASPALRRVETASAFLDALGSPEPTVCPAHVHRVLQEQDRWFGELAESRRGGAVALATLAPRVDGEERILLCNPAALGLVVLDDDAGADPATLRRDGVVSVAAWGATPGKPGYERGLRRLIERCSHESVEAALATAGNSRFVTMMLLTAPVDPGVRIPRGLVMSQQGMTGAQTMAVAVPIPQVVVRPGQAVPIITPAWCLNRELAAPDGQPLSPTPLQFTAPDGAGQDQVWDLIGVRRAQAIG